MVVVWWVVALTNGLGKGDYWLPPPIIRAASIRKTGVDPDDWEGNGHSKQKGSNEVVHLGKGTTRFWGY